MRIRDGAAAVALGLIVGLGLGIVAARPEPVLVAAAPVAVKALPALGVSLPARVVDVHDGDTLTVRVTFCADIRLLDCWARELKEPGGSQARDALVELANGKSCVLTVPFEGAKTIGDVLTFGRVLGRVRIDGVDASEWMVQNGFAGRTKADEAKLVFPKGKE